MRENVNEPNALYAAHLKEPQVAKRIVYYDKSNSLLDWTYK